MKPLKTTLIALTVISGAWLGWSQWKRTSYYLEGRAFHLYQQNKSQNAYEQLAALEEKLPLPRLLLLEAYTLRELQPLQRSTQRLNQALEALRGHAKPDALLLLEIGLNLALNGYLTSDSLLLTKGLQIAREADQHSPWIVAFEALQAQQEGRFAQATELGKRAAGRHPLSQWMSRPFDRVFPVEWDTLLEARSLIEEGRTAQARELIAKLPHKGSIACQLLLSLAYLREGQERPSAMARGYFELALAHTALLPSAKATLGTDYDLLVKAFLAQFNRSLAELQWKDADFYLQVLLQAQLTQPLEEAKGQLMRAFVDHLWHTGILADLSSYPTLQEQLSLEGTEKQIEGLIAAQFLQGCEDNAWPQLQKLLTLLLQDKGSSSLVHKLQEALRSFIESKLKVWIKDIEQGKSVEKSLQSLYQLMPLLAEVQHYPVALESSLMGQARLGYVEDYPTVCHTLLEQTLIALLNHQPLAPESGVLLEALVKASGLPQQPLLGIIKEQLGRRFMVAYHSQDLETMTVLSEISRRLTIDLIPAYAPDTIANLVADSRFLLEEGSFDRASKLLRWIVEIEPNHPQAWLLLGSSFFAQNRFQEAAAAFEHVQNLTPEAQQLLAICYFQGQQGEKGQAIIQRCQAQKVRISPRLWFTLAKYLMTQQQWQQASMALNHLDTSPAQVGLCRLICACKTGAVQEAWKAYDGLPNEWKGDERIAALALKSLQGQPLYGMVQAIITATLPQKEEAASSDLPQEAQLLLTSLFTPHELDLATLAARYLPINMGNSTTPEPLQALIRGLAAEPWQEAMDRALEWNTLNLPSSAYDALVSHPPTQLDPAHLPYWLLLADLLRQGGQLTGAAKLLESLYQQIGSEPELLQAHSRLYQDMRRHDLACELLKPHKAHSDSSIRVAYLENLVQSGRFEEALNCYGLLGEQTQPSLVWRIHLSMLPVWRSAGKEISWPTRHLFDELGNNDKVFVLEHLWDAGEWTRVREWSSQQLETLRSCPRGELLALKIALAQRSPEEVPALLSTLSWPKIIGKISLLETLEWFDLLDSCAQQQMMEQMLTQQQSKALQNATSLTLPTGQVIDLKTPLDMLELLKSYIELSAIQKTSEEGAPLLSNKGSWLEKIAQLASSQRDDQGGLHPFWLAGKAQRLLHRDDIPDLLRCILIDPSFLPPYLEEGALLQSQRLPTRGVALLKQAKLYHPTHARLNLALAQCWYAIELQQGGNRWNQTRHWIAQTQLYGGYLSELLLLQGRLAVATHDWEEGYRYLTRFLAYQPQRQEALLLLIGAIEGWTQEKGQNVEREQELARLYKRVSELMATAPSKN